MKYPENEKKDACIGFICEYPFHYYLYKNIYKYLKNAEFILTNEIYPANEYYDNKLREMADFYSHFDIHWRIFSNRDKRPELFFSKYKLLIAPLYKGCIRRKYNIDKKKVRVLYGPGKDLVDYGIGNCYFDLILAYGEHSRRQLSIYTVAKNVGYPKYDDWYNGEIDKESVAAVKKRLDSHKKTVLYAPTYGKFSSIDEFGDNIIDLAERFNLIVKFHHISLWDEKTRIKKFFDARNIIIFPDEQNIMPLLAHSDIVVSDNSGAIFEAVLVDKPVILLGKPENEILNDLGSTKVKRKLLQPALTYSGSIEQTIRRPGREIGIVVEKSGDLGQSVTMALAGDPNITERRRKLRDKLFSRLDGKAGFRAANEIAKLLSQAELKEKFLAVAVKSYINNLLDNQKN